MFAALCGYGRCGSRRTRPDHNHKFDFIMETFWLKKKKNRPKVSTQRNRFSRFQRKKNKHKVGPCVGSEMNWNLCIIRMEEGLHRHTNVNSLCIDDKLATEWNVTNIAKRVKHHNEPLPQFSHVAHSLPLLLLHNNNAEKNINYISFIAVFVRLAIKSTEKRRSGACVAKYGREARGTNEIKRIRPAKMCQ